MKKLIPILFLLILIGCSSEESLIKKDLKSRFVGYELIEIKPEKSCMKYLGDIYLGLQLTISSQSRVLSQAECGYLKIEGYEPKTYKEVKELYKSSMDRIIKADSSFRWLQYDKSEDCYLVKYLVYDGPNKIPKEDIYYLRTYGQNKDKIELLHRPNNWDEYIQEIDYNSVVAKKVIKLMDNQWEFTKQEFIKN